MAGNGKGGGGGAPQVPLEGGKGGWAGLGWGSRSNEPSLPFSKRGYGCGGGAWLGCKDSPPAAAACKLKGSEREEEKGKGLGRARGGGRCFVCDCVDLVRMNVRGEGSVG